MSLHPPRSYPQPPCYDNLTTRQIARRWSVLAEQRLNHLTELFETGRWRRYHNEVDFVDNLREAKDAVARWQAMANGDFVTPEIRDVSSVQPAAVVEAEVVSFEDHVSQRAAARPAIHVATVGDAPAIAVAEEAQPVDQAPAASTPITDWTKPVDLDAIRDRYPILRAAM